MIDSDLMVAGYVLMVPTNPPPGMATVPKSIVTISGCLMHSVPRPEFWDWFTRLDEAQTARSNHPQAAQITTVALRPSDAVALMDEMGGAHQPYFAQLSGMHPLRDADVLGYEVVGAEHSLTFHSWHCHGYADEAYAALGVRVNDLGLLPSYADAARVLNWMLSRPESEAPAPVLWVVVALARGD